MKNIFKIFYKEKLITNIICISGIKVSESGNFFVRSLVSKINNLTFFRTFQSSFNDFHVLNNF